MIQQLTAIVPSCKTLATGAANVYSSSKNVLSFTCSRAQATVTAGWQRSVELKTDLEILIWWLFQQTSEEFFRRVETLVGVQNEKFRKMGICERTSMIRVTFMREYVQRYTDGVQNSLQPVFQQGKKYYVYLMAPLHIYVKSVLIVSKEMLTEFLSKRFDKFKMTYKASKDQVVMFVNGQFDPKLIKDRIIDNIDCLTEIAVNVVERGLEIQIDRKVLMENYDRFAVNLLQLTEDMRSKGLTSFKEIRSQSKALYERVVSRIRAKKIEIRIEMQEWSGESQKKIELLPEKFERTENFEEINEDISYIEPVRLQLDQGNMMEMVKEQLSERSAESQKKIESTFMNSPEKPEQFPAEEIQTTEVARVQAEDKLIEEEQDMIRPIKYEQRQIQESDEEIQGQPTQEQEQKPSAAEDQEIIEEVLPKQDHEDTQKLNQKKKNKNKKNKKK